MIAKLRSWRLVEAGNGINGEFFGRVADELERLMAENSALRQSEFEAIAVVMSTEGTIDRLAIELEAISGRLRGMRKPPPAKSTR